MNCTLLQELQVLQMLHILATESNCKVATLLPSEVKRTLPCGVEGAQGKCRIVLLEKWKLRGASVCERSMAPPRLQLESSCATKLGAVRLRLTPGWAGWGTLSRMLSACKGRVLLWLIMRQERRQVDV